MNRVVRMIDLFRDSPSYGQDRANLVSGLTIGVTGLLLNSAVLMLLLPLMVDPNDPDFRRLTGNIEFGQLLALILLGGATGFATFLIPLRLVTVFWGPRVGRYFDQVVLTGITPFRFIIGKATSQNLFLALVLFLLLPWMVLSLTLGGVSPGSIVAGLFLLWLYCMALALVTLWMSLYFNELIAAGMVVGGAMIVAILGCAPLPIQPFVLTPFPALVHPVYSSMTVPMGQSTQSFFEVFLWCAACMAGMSCVAMAGIYLGPLYGIVRENSTFGEVVRRGDSRRKRRFRIRPHIQRPSEIAFFFENRGQSFSRHEGLIRWGSGLCFLFCISGAATWTVIRSLGTSISQMNLNGSVWWVYEFHTIYLTIHGIGLALAILFFSHSKNCTRLRLPLIFGKAVEVARLDTYVFVLFLLVSTAVSIATPFYIDGVYATAAGGTIFPNRIYGAEGPEIDFVRIAIEGSLVISVSGVVVYAFQRLLCLVTWVKSATLVLVSILYFIGICLVPLLFAVLSMDYPQFRNDPLIQMVGPRLAMASPFMAVMVLFNEAGGSFPDDVSTPPFYVAHGILFLLALIGIRQCSRRLVREYLPPPAEEHGP